MEKVEKAGAQTPDYIYLSDHTSKRNMDLYVAVDKELPDAENITISGNFFGKVYEGDFKNTNKWCKDFDAYTTSNHMKIEKQYMRYTTCPKCAKKYGKNYVAILGKIAW